MENDSVHDSGLAPQHGGEGAQGPEYAPEELGKETASPQELRKLFKDLRKWKSRYRELNSRRIELEEREKALKELKGRLAQDHITRLLTDTAAAQDAINPQQVAEFLHERVSLGEDLDPVVAVPEDAPDGSAGPASVPELVAEFLSRYPYHRKARLSGGSGSAPSPVAMADTLKEQIRSATSHEELQKIVSRKQP